MNLVTLSRQYSTQERCRELLRRMRWPNGAICPRCGHKGTCWLGAQEKYECNRCRYQFSVTAGTVFHDSHLPLEKWFLAVHLLCEAKKGMSAAQLQRTLGIGSYKTAWYLCHRIRSAMKEAETAQLTGIVEADETRIGGRARGAGKGHYHDTKAIVVGAIQRGGPIRLKVAKDVRRETLHDFVRTTVDLDKAKLYTDEWTGYKGLPNHESVNHRAKQWVRAGGIHTNSVENAWSLFKRSIVGSFHQVSDKHLQAYLDEFSFRFNRRKSEQLFVDTLKALVAAPKLPFAQLTAEQQPAAAVR